MPSGMIAVAAIAEERHAPSLDTLPDDGARTTAQVSTVRSGKATRAQAGLLSAAEPLRSDGNSTRAARSIKWLPTKPAIADSANSATSVVRR